MRRHRSSFHPVLRLAPALLLASTAFAETGIGQLNGAIALLGTAKVCLFGACGAPLANLSVPLSVIGVGGSAAVTGLVDVTVIGAPWTTGTAAGGSFPLVTPI